MPDELEILLICSGAITVGMITVCGLINRIWFISKMALLSKLSDEPTWKVWRLSAVEPAVTTIISAIWLFTVTRSLDDNGIIANYSLHVVAQMCILAFVARIWVVGEGCQRGRLTITVLLTRLAILTAPLIATVLGVRSYTDGFEIVAGVSILVAFIVRALFGMYQNRVTPNRAQFVRQQTEAQINLGRREIEDGVTLIDDLDLWNQQVALIERLKAEENA